MAASGGRGLRGHAGRSGLLIRWTEVPARAPCGNLRVGGDSAGPGVGVAVLP